MLLFFSDNNVRRIQTSDDDPDIISIVIANYDAKRILIDNESFVKVLFYDTFVKMNLPRDRLRKVSTPLIGFDENPLDLKEKSHFM